MLVILSGAKNLTSYPGVFVRSFAPLRMTRLEINLWE